MSEIKTEKFASWRRYSPEEMDKSVKFMMETVSSCKTEREWVRWLEQDLAKRGSVKSDSLFGLKPGDSVYMNWKGRAMVSARIGKSPLSSGFNLIASHIDSPRIDVKGRPLYEDGNLALFDCHYYGGLKKYQWTNVPLALHGEIHKGDGSMKTVVLGERSDEPILIIPDLEPHVDRDMAKRKASETVLAEDLDAIVGNRPSDSKDDPVKGHIAKWIEENWGIELKDLVSAELALVPAGPARLSGLDGSLVAAYGLDDRICASMSYKAFWDMETPEKTAVFMAVDREEIGSESIGGAQGAFLDLFLLELLKASGETPDALALRKLYSKSSAVSADVTSGRNPLYDKNYVRDQQLLAGNGVGIDKFTGAGGKYDGNEARGEFVAKVIAALEKSQVPWQTGSFGKVDKAGGGTIAVYLARSGMDTIDMGPALLSMHSPMELVSCSDTEALYRAFRAVYENLL